MPNPIEIENIEEMRRQQGIDDIELTEAVRRLQVGDVVRLTFLKKPSSFDTAPVQITHIRGIAFRGKLVRPVTCLGRGKSVEFTIAHIHSIVASPAKFESCSSLR